MDTLSLYRGDVVCCYPGTEYECYGVVVRLPIDGQSKFYRVRLKTKAFDHYVEIGVLAGELHADPKNVQRR